MWSFYRNHLQHSHFLSKSSCAFLTASLILCDLTRLYPSRNYSKDWARVTRYTQWRCWGTWWCRLHLRTVQRWLYHQGFYGKYQLCHQSRVLNVGTSLTQSTVLTKVYRRSKTNRLEAPSDLYSLCNTITEVSRYQVRQPQCQLDFSEVTSERWEPT